jgi:hypothetical protein
MAMEQGAEHSAEHGAVDDGAGGSRLLCGGLKERNDTVLLRCVVSFL